MKFPNDADGDVLRRLADDGFDFSIKRLVEFSCYISEDLANSAASDLTEYGYKVSIFKDEEDNTVSLYIGLTMHIEYDLVVLEQKRISLILSKYDSHCDGWLTRSG